MGAKDIAVDVLASWPCRNLLLLFERLPYGRDILNRFSLQRGVFATFEQAWSVARRGRHAGHDHPDAITLHFELSRALRASDYAVLYWLCRIGAQEGNLKVLDFGGNAGNLYYSYLSYLKETVQPIAWTVFDLPAVIEEGRRIGAERNATALTFTDSLNDASDANVLLVSGAFHYWETSVGAFFDAFSRPPEHVILNRTPVHEKQAPFITVQRTESYAVPCIVRNTGDLMSSFAALGYRLVDRWPALELRLLMPLFPERTVPHYSGFYFCRQKRT